MSDLVKRLREYATDFDDQELPNGTAAAGPLREAAARIEALEAALKPFANLYAEILALQKANPDMPQDLDGWALTCTGPDLRHAASLLEPKP